MHHIFSIKHICKNSKGIHLDGWGTKTVERYERMGKEGKKMVKEK